MTTNKQGALAAVLQAIAISFLSNLSAEELEKIRGGDKDLMRRLKSHMVTELQARSGLRLDFNAINMTTNLYIYDKRSQHLDVDIETVLQQRLP